MKTRVFENPVKFAQSVKIKVDGEYISLLELLQNADIELDETPTSGSDKAVSSGGVYSALQEKQGQISITENDDGSVDINIPDAGEVSTGGVTIIDVGTEGILEEDIYHVDLSKNGKYILFLDTLGDKKAQIELGTFKAEDRIFGKFIVYDYERTQFFLDGLYAGHADESSIISVIQSDANVYLEVKDEYVIVLVQNEI